MTERDLFDAIGRLPERFRTEALDEPAEDAGAENEIAAIFAKASEKKQNPQPAEPKLLRHTAEQQTAAPIQKIKADKPMRHSIIWMTAAAAALALCVGVFAWRSGHDSARKDPAMTNLSEDSVREERNSGDETASQQMENSTADQSSTSNTEQAESDTSAPGENDAETDYAENALGGHGIVRTVIGDGYYLIAEDDDYWYTDGRSRISKTKTNDAGHLESELLCQTAGCPHTYPGCKFHDFNGMMSDGTYLYLANQNENLSLDSNEMKRLNPDGTSAHFFSLNVSQAMLEALDDMWTKEAGFKFREAHDFMYLHIIRLGDTDRYYISVTADSSSHGAPLRFCAGILLDYSDRWGYQLLKGSYMQPHFDADNDLLYLTVPPSDSDEDFKIMKPQHDDVVVYDLKQTEMTSFGVKAETVLQPIASLANAMTGAPLGGKYYYLTGTQYDYPRKPIDFCCFDPRTGEKTVLEENTDKQSLFAADGKLYYHINAHVGKDKILCCDPDGQNEEVIYETPGKIRQLCGIADRSFIDITLENGEAFIINGKEYLIDNFWV